MGSQESKNEGPFERDVEKEDPVIGSTTPVQMSSLDPRSPTTLFARTPIETVILGNKIEPLEKPQTVHLGEDPRSPSTDYQRTPIIIEVPSKKLRNKNFDNVLKSSMQTPVLEVQNKRRSLAGLLETNLDFTETNLDEVFLNKSRQSTTPERLSQLVTDEAVPETPKAEVEEVPEVEAAEETFEDAKVTLDLEDAKVTVTLDLEDAKVSLEVATVIPEATKEIFEVPEETPEVTKQSLEIVDKHFDDTINITALSKNFDKKLTKLTNLIYEDDDEYLSPKMGIVDRTPLRTRNANSEPRKHLQKLRVSDKPRKSEGISRIPVFKKAGVQCENTPPRKANMHGKRAEHMTKWDADKTLII